MTGRLPGLPLVDRCAPLRVLDLINTDNSAKELLENRVAHVNATGRYDNAIYCSAGPYVQTLRNRGHTVFVVDTPRELSPVALAAAAWKTFRVLRRHRFYVVHTHGSVIGVIGRVAAWLARTPVVIHQVHGFHHHDNMPSLKRSLFVGIERVMAWGTDRILFQAKADLDECVRRHIAPARKLVWVGNGVQLDVFRPRGVPENDPPTIVCIARFEGVKNHMMLLRGARLLKQRGIRFMLTLAGDGALRTPCENWTTENGLAESVRFMGYADDVAGLTAGADVCVLTSVKEGVPRALMEAAACGRPVVATDVSGNREAVVDGVTGFLVPLDDPVALADRLERLLAEPALRVRMGQAALERARNQYDERIVCDRILAVYDELCDRACSCYTPDAVS
jgi:glycosyltransferase involved in cell wall biosynthesis